MGFSKLATVFISPDPNCYDSRHGTTIDSVAIHTMSGNSTVEGVGTWFAVGGVYAQTGNPASSNYGIDSTGKIAGYVDEDNRSYCTSSGGVDRRAITIEVASTTSAEPYECTDAAYESLLKLLVDICQRHNIPALRWKADKAYAEAAAAGGSVDEQNMFVHRWFSPDGKTCPGEYLYSHHGAIATEVNKRLGNNERYTDGSTVGGDSNANTGTSAQTITIDYKQIDPYMVTLDRKSEVDYDILKSAKVIGAIVEAGCRFETNGMLTKKFESPKLKEQVEGLKKVDINYGLYMTCRARNSNEAKMEMEQFAFSLRKYGAKLGAWLNLEISENDIYNTPILNRYKQDLIRLGFKGRMGIICTRDFLKHIKWDTDSDTDTDADSTTTKQATELENDVNANTTKKFDYKIKKRTEHLDAPNFKKDFYLWLVEHVEDVSELDKLLDPEFFDIDGKG